jgi:hypothetical protein
MTSPAGGGQVAAETIHRFICMKRLTYRKGGGKLPASIETG